MTNFKRATVKTTKHIYSFYLSATDFDYLQKEFHFFVWDNIFSEKGVQGINANNVWVYFTSRKQMTDYKFRALNFLYSLKNDGKFSSIQ